MRPGEVIRDNHAAHVLQLVRKLEVANAEDGRLPRGRKGAQSEIHGRDVKSQTLYSKYLGQSIQPEQNHHHANNRVGTLTYLVQIQTLSGQHEDAIPASKENRGNHNLERMRAREITDNASMQI